MIFFGQPEQAWTKENGGDPPVMKTPRWASNRPGNTERRESAVVHD
jgi:hypothetical protein